MITYPFAIPSGSNITPLVGGSNAIGSSGNPIGSIYANTNGGVYCNVQTMNPVTLNATNITGVNITATNISGANITFGNSIVFSGVQALGIATLATISFGSIPTTNATFTITGVNAGLSNNILMYPSPVAAPGRVGNDDWYWDDVNLSAYVSSPGTITVYAKTENGSTVMGSRNVLYTIC